MKIGPYDVYSIETGRFALDGGAMFGVVPKPLWEKSNPADGRNRITMAARAMLLVGGGRRILIDTGNGHKLSEKLSEIYRIDHTHSTLLGSLAARGVTPEMITDVVLTHLHFDHAGGATTPHQGLPVPTFPNARYYVQKEHWEAALSPTERDRASFFREDFVPLREHGVLEFTEGEGELFPGLRLVCVNGHTTALQLVLLSDASTTLLYCADLVPMASHVQLPWIMAYDLRPLVTLEEKRRLLTAAVAERWVLFFEHDPLTTAARIREGEKGIVIDSVVPIE